jgi:hypothetical protein
MTVPEISREFVHADSHRVGDENKVSRIPRLPPRVSLWAACDLQGARRTGSLSQSSLREGASGSSPSTWALFSARPGLSDRFCPCAVRSAFATSALNRFNSRKEAAKSLGVFGGRGLFMAICLLDRRTQPTACRSIAGHRLVPRRGLEGAFRLWSGAGHTRSKCARAPHRPA